MNTPKFLSVINILEKEYPKWQAAVLDLIALETGDPFKILISTILSLRTQDKTTTAASKRLYAVADTPATMAALTVSEIQKLIYPVGFYKNKAGQIKTIAEYLCTHPMPKTREGLMAFKGVGRKTANLVLALGFGIPAICVDTHVHRITNRLGFVQTKNPEETEFALMEKVPQKDWNRLNALLVAFGQTICRPVGPKCTTCPVNKSCLFFKSRL
jgi:endonuclease-3